MAGSGTLYLMRHGATALDVDHRSDGWLDLPLSPAGQRSVMPAQQKLKMVPLKTIYTPGLKRTTETAELVASGTLSKPKVKTTDAAKTWNLGVLAGTRKRYSRPEVKRLIKHPREAPLGGESYGDFTARFLPWFERCADQSTGGSPALVVCSGSNLRCLGEKLFGDSDTLDLDEGGLVVLRRVKGVWTAETLCGAKTAFDAVSAAVRDAEPDEDA